MSKRSRKCMYVKRFLEKEEESDEEFKCKKKNIFHKNVTVDLNRDNTTSLSPAEESMIFHDAISSGSSDNNFTEIRENYSFEYDIQVDGNPNLQLTLPGQNIISHLNKNANASTSSLSITGALKNWALSHDVNHKQINALLKILKPYHVDLPLDSRTLLGTTRTLNISSMLSQNNTEGEYIYFGIQKTLEHLLEGNLGLAIIKRNITSIQLKCNVDGLKIHKSTSIDFWPILAAVHVEGLKTTPFVVAIYMGDSKPKCLESFLTDFITEIKLLSQTGLTSGTKKYTFSLKYLVCDAPARAFLKVVKCHNGYYACERCNVKGERINGRFIYKLDENAEKRTHLTFITQIHKGHHLGVSPLTELEHFDMIFGFPLDYMHMVCLGIMRRLLNYWFKSDSEYRLSPTFRKEVSARIIEIASWVPKEFGRRPRSLVELDRWKATEFRFFLLYIGVYVLKGILPKEKYKHFLHLACAMRIICSRNSSKSLGDIAVNCIKSFCTRFEDIYDANIETIFNTHSIYHLVEDSVQMNENPEDINCFIFENYLGQLKKMIRTANKPLSQVCKRLAEQKDKDIFLKDSCIGPQFSLIFDKCNNIKAIEYKNMYISKVQKDSFILLSSKKVMSVNKIIKDQNSEIQLHGSVYQCTENIFSLSAVTSSALNMYRVKNLSKFQFSAFLKDIITKCIVFPLKDCDDYLGAIGLLHINY